MFPGGMDFEQLLAQAQQMQAQLANAQAELADLRVSGTAGGDLVTATMTGDGELVDLVIDAQAVELAADGVPDTETLADLVVAAVRDAREQVARASAERMGPVTQGLGGLGGGLGGALGPGASGLGQAGLGQSGLGS